jgi:hypothetical protein
MTPRWTVVLVLLLAGCGPGPIAPDDFQSAYVKAWCGRAARCGVVADATLCEAGNLYDGAQARASIEAGRAGYDGDAARDCVDGIDADACTFYDVPACSAVVTGVRQPGESCFASFECAGGSCAPTGSCTDTCCLGTCVASVGVGGSCSSQADCADGLVCTAASGADTVTCQPRAALGEQCTYSELCAEGLFCAVVYQPDDTTIGKCEAPAARGDACDTTSPSLSCRSVEDYCSPTTSTCVARVEVGSPCENLHTGPFPGGGSCRWHAYCDVATGLCRPLGAGVGASCRDASCEYGYVCNADRLCEPAPVQAVCE